MRYDNLISCSWRLLLKTKYSLRINSQRTFISKGENVKDFVSSLTVKERISLLNELNRRLQFTDIHSKENNSLSSSSTKITGDKADEVKAVEKDLKDEQPPTISELRLVFIHQALPFVGFGFLDNLIMILAGEYIDTTLGLTLGISTMAAAGLGNAISDVAGIGSAWYVENIASRVGIQFPKITETQSDMARTRWSIHLGRVFGVFIGCLLGMFPLLFLPNKETIKEKKD